MAAFLIDKATKMRFAKRKPQVLLRIRRDLRTCFLGGVTTKEIMEIVKLAKEDAQV